MSRVWRFLAYGLFYGYAGLLVMAGLWGALFAPEDFEWVLHFDLGDGDPQGLANVLGQYRFLRGIEFGIGVALLATRREIFSRRAPNRLFLVIIGAGVAGRALSLAVDGTPSPLFLFFLAAELLGMVAVAVHTRTVGLR